VRQMRMLKAAGARLARPQLSASFAAWRHDFDETLKAATARAYQSGLSEEHESRLAAEAELRRTRADFEQRYAFAQVAATHERDSLSEKAAKLSAVEIALADARQAAQLSKRAEEAALEEAERANRETARLLDAQTAAAEARLRELLAEQFSKMERERRAVEETLLKERTLLKEQVAVQEEELRRLRGLKEETATHKEELRQLREMLEALKRAPPPPAPVPPPAAAPIKFAKVVAKAKDNNAFKKGSVLAGVDIDENSDIPMIDQLRGALKKSAARVMDLFREWDTDGDGSVSKKEFRKAMPLLGFTVAKEEVDKLFDEFDPDGSGQVGFKELQKMLKGPSAPPPAPAAKSTPGKPGAAAKPKPKGR